MLTLEDCIALSDLTEDEIDAIAEHEHIPEMAAIELGSYLIHRPDGTKVIRQIIIEDIVAAQARGKYAHSAWLKMVLRRFVKRYRGSLADVADAGGA